MASAKEQGELWSARAHDWAGSGEPAWRDVFTAVLDQAKIGKGTGHLDIGCGAGGALVLARQRGAVVAGFDAAQSLAAIARTRLPGAEIMVGDMAALPFADESFDVVTGINVFQFADDPAIAFAEAARVAKRGGTVTMLVWGRRDKCELMSEVMPAVVALGSPSASPAKPPLVETADGFMRAAGLDLEICGDLAATLVYADRHAAANAILAASESTIRHAGEARVRGALNVALAPFVGEDGAVRLRNMFRLVTGRRPA
ncbi:class I SAM-dependent methyltransferase [Nordella sp. HKS 07]|uniref:class I SAM-dependent methyltransferase n=1 Tax=Nordella sp. HKS 07 TaxID=2712222 RepID=UPI0013E10B4C|nr:class I SAM-dependent methyltransferase [Nordella sp. HKS 07]QIG50836.1 class I SAM-dependent methyltransferase [Nordella sp. HKS 07]